MDTLPGSNPMENPPHSPLGGLDPADLLKQGAAEDTFMDGAANSFNPPPIEELAAIFPQFEILELIGQGGMGAVYKVRQKDLDRVVALKILPPAIGQSPEFSNRFTREAKALAKLNHPGIVTIHEFGQQDGLYFILMEFVDGVNLAQLMKSGRISPREALAIIPQICDALQFAHDQGIVHRDIKPENILLDRLGRVKVADFGIAKVVAAVCDPIRSGDTPVPTDATLHGKILGTPQYMAPEQISHPAEVDHRADIYALGVVFYQMLTGELPGKRLEAPSKKVHIDVRLDEIVLRAMEKEPELRYQTAHEFRTVVDGVQAPAQALPPSLSQPPPKRGLLRWWWVFLIMFPLGLLIGLAAASGLTYFTPKQYEVQTIIEVIPEAGSVMSANFFGSQFEAIKSENALVAVAEQLELPKKWMLSQDAVVQKLRHITTTQNIRGTDLTSIRVRHNDKQEAAAIVSLVAQQYQRSFPGKVVVHEEPSEPNTPVSPNVRLNLVIGGLLGIILSPLLGIILIAILQLLFPETKSTNSPRQPSQQASVMKTCEDELVAPRAVPASPIVKERSTAKIIAVGCGVLALVVVVGLVGLSTVFWFYTELRHDTARGKTQAARQETRESIARAEQNSKEVNERSHTSPNSKETPKKLDTHPLLMTEFGEFMSEESLWSIRVPAQDRTLHISRQPGSSGIGMSISPSKWRAQNGWFAFIEDENHAWAYDGGEKLMLVEVTPEKSTVYETEMILRTVPDAILPRISQSTRDKIGIKSTPESRRLANRLSETEVAVPAARRQAGIAAGNHGEGRNDAARFFPSAITESAWVVPLGLMLSLLLAIILIAILRRLFPKTKTENSALQANRQVSSKDQVAEKVNVAGNDSSRTQSHVDSFAVTSLVFGIVSLVLGPLGSLPAIIFGHVALSRIKTNSSLTGRGYALAGVVLGYTTLVLLVMAIVVLISLRPVSSNHASSSNGDIPVKASGYFVR